MVFVFIVITTFSKCPAKSFSIHLCARITSEKKLAGSTGKFGGVWKNARTNFRVDIHNVFGEYFVYNDILFTLWYIYSPPSDLDMFDQIERCTSRFKIGLIRLGYCLPPASSMYSNKIKQIHLDLKHMYVEFVGSPGQKTLFEMATAVILATIGQYFHIKSLEQLLSAITKACKYLETY